MSEQDWRLLQLQCPNLTQTEHLADGEGGVGPQELCKQKTTKTSNVVFASKVIYHLFMVLVGKNARFVLAALCVSFLAAKQSLAEPGLSCVVDAVQMTLPSSGAPQMVIAGPAQVHVQCSPTPKSTNPSGQMAKSSYPTNIRAGQVTWSTADSDGVTSSARTDAVVHRFVDAVSGPTMARER
ncbi:MAG: hypothetical protein Q8S92_03565 [Hydrogenophaga sp.]|uniref:hypothetical protein n=1 Tax=Hydrogenophaga sp. TaxID=1904254 RepID=UPI0027360C02|nr:hypothetical protein [Hydrogenophaga sp.]MDP3348058.1 hypothetical protein [Hydrogenophaga sp.]